MSQAIQAFTPPPPSYPYQGNLQQQFSAVGAPSSSSMGNGEVIVLGGVIATTLLGVGTLVAVTQLGTRSAKKPPTSQVPQFVPFPQPAPHPQHEPIIDIIPGFPGFIYRSDGVYREEGESCGKCAYSTVRRAFGMEPITEEKFKEIVPKALYPGTLATHLIALADRDGLDAKEHFPAQFGGARIDNIKAFIILLNPPPPLKPHCVTLVYSEIKKGFCLSDNADQGSAMHEIYSGTATEAFLEYQKRHNFIAHSVVSFLERVPAQDMVPQRPFLPLR
jgi:hypothetical protein